MDEGLVLTNEISDEFVHRIFLSPLPEKNRLKLSTVKYRREQKIRFLIHRAKDEYSHLPFLISTHLFILAALYSQYVFQECPLVFLNTIEIMLNQPALNIERFIHFKGMFSLSSTLAQQCSTEGRSLFKVG
jgi:hypothetical protein